MATTAALRSAPTIAATTRASRMPGKPNMTSKARATTASNQPPRQAAATARATPAVVARVVTASGPSRAVREPQTRRARMSRPLESVPRGWSADGGAKLSARSPSAGSPTGSSGAAIITIARAASTSTAARPLIPALPAHPRVEGPVGGVDQGVDDDEGGYEQERDRLHDREVLADHGLDQQRADPVEVEGPLDHHRGRQQAGDGQPRDRDDRDHGVADDVAADDLRGSQPAGARGLDVLAAQLLLGRGSGDAGDVGELGEGHGDGREDEVPDAAAEPGPGADRREPAQPDREHPGQDDGGDEAGDGLADHGGEQDAPVQQAAPEPSDQAEADAAADDQHRGHGDQQRGRRGPGPDEVGDPGAEGERLARVAPDQVAQPGEVPGEERIVEVVLVAQGLDRLGGQSPASRQRGHRVAGGEIQRREDQ